jgi:glutathione S-transferase
MGLIGTLAFALFRPPALINGFTGRFIPALGRTTTLVSTTSLYLASDGSNPFSSFIGDMASSLMGKTVSSLPQVDKSLANIDVPSWEDIRFQLESLQTDEERSFRQNIENGHGIGSPMHKMRLYDETNTEKDIRVTFYRDSASWCPYCQKVWMTLEEKRIPYRVVKVNMRCYGDKPASFIRLQPGGQIPVAVIDGRVYGQSNDILYALEELFPDKKTLLPPKGKETTANESLRLERQLFGAWLSWLSGGSSRRPRDQFIEVLNTVEQTLSVSGPFFLGKDVTMVDMMFAPFLERICASLLYFKGFQIRVSEGAPTDFPAVNRWFDAMEALPSYRLTKSDYYSHAHDLPPQLGGCTYEPASAPYVKAIDGERTIDGQQGSWELPLRPNNDGVEPDWKWVGDEDVARREAVERLSANHGAIVKFASRGAGRKGIPPVSAPLADPNAVSNDAVEGALSLVLQIVCLALLEGTKTQEIPMSDLAAILNEMGGQEYAAGVISSLAYLRDRVGVPRDMTLPAAKELRAHINWAIGKILDTQDS